MNAVTMNILHLDEDSSGGEEDRNNRLISQLPPLPIQSPVLGLSEDLSPPSQSQSSTDSASVTKSAKETYIESGNHKGILLMLCLGLTGENERPLGDPSDHPYNKLTRNNKSKFTVDKKALLSEIERRIKTESVKEKVRPKNWNASRLKNWLIAHPVTDPNDKEYLLRTEQAICVATENKINSMGDQSKQSTETSDRAPSWTGNIPYLRMYICSIQDEVKIALRHSAKVLSRPELDARNHEERPKSFYEALADKFNDESFQPSTEAYPSLHHDFGEPILITRPFEVNAETIKKKWAECKAKLSKVASRYDRSGNGDGQLAEEEGSSSSDSDEEEHFAHMTRERLAAGDHRSSFLWDHLGEKPHLLYFWQIADEHEILSHVVSKMDPRTAATGDSVPTKTADTQNPRKRGRPPNKNTQDEEAEEAKLYRDRTAAAMDEEAYQSVMENHREACKELKTLKLSKLRSQDENEKQLYQEFIDIETKRLQELEDRMGKYDSSRKKSLYEA